MAKLLYIKASPRGGRSHSVAAADAFVESYKAANPADEVVTIDLFQVDLPAFDGDALDAKYAILNGTDHSPEQKAAWQAVEEIIDEFRSADKFVIALPMWNFGIPYKLKHYVDILVQPGYTFSFSPEEGYKGLVTGKPVLLSCARGGEYPPGTALVSFDFQKTYMEHILGFIGFTDIRSVVIEPTLMGGPAVAEQKRTAALDQARQMAKDF